MRYAILSDVHSNLEALEAVLEDLDRKKIEDLLFLGDAVGYGPNPNECMEILLKRCNILLAGNHDWGVLGHSHQPFIIERLPSGELVTYKDGVQIRKDREIHNECWKCGSAEGWEPGGVLCGC